MSYYSIKDKEGTIINNVAAEFFADYDCRKLIGNIDFSVAIPQTGKELFPEIEYVLWAEAKMGVKHKLYESFIQLILTIGRERTIDKVMPPKFLGAFDAEKIAFIPFSAIREIFNQNDFNWNVTPSDHSTKEFAQLKQMVQSELARTNKEKDNVFVFDYFTDKRDLKKFIARNFVSGRDSIQRMRITYNNFTHIYEKWCREVKPSIAVDWENVKKTGLLDADFYLADIMSGDNNTLLENLHVLLKSNHYELDRKVDTYGFVSSSSVPFYDNMVAHSTFWAKYSRPPKKEYWDKIVERRDLLVPQDIRERKGSYFTPRIWVEKSQEYLADVLGENWQDEYYIWDCCAGTGNLLAGLTNKYNIWASTLDKADVDVMHERIENMGENSNLLKSHVFQFDFLNGDFDQLPEGLQEIINDEEKRKKLVIYINPPYAEAGNAKQRTNKEINKPKTGVSVSQKTYERYLSQIGIAGRELFAQFFIRIYQEIPGVTLAEFSTLKILQAPNFVDFRAVFRAKLENLFLVPANTFDNVKGQFPIGFFIWDTNKKEIFESIDADVFDAQDRYLGTKNIFALRKDQKTLTDWVVETRVKGGNTYVGYICNRSNDFQSQSSNFIANTKEQFSTPRGSIITDQNLVECTIFYAVRHVIPATWINDRDQFLYPNDGWKYDKDFQSDCLAYSLFNNNIQCEFGINHWIPFTEQQVKAPDNFKSHFMSDFIAGKLAPKDAETLFGAEENLIPTEPIQFTPIAQAVMEAGRKIWEYYMAQKPKIYGAEPINVNASFYDIRVYFQGRDDKGRMRSDSEDQTYMSLLRDLRNNQKILAKQIEKKVYLYGFLKGEVEVSAQELAAELKETQKEIISLRKQLQSQHAAQVVNYGTININDNSKNIKF
ncbi:MAG: hypothetical protein U0K81_08680 [Paludibacteraceae bacterium]|nr:hypothetical protein [Paludibacteraceae bacterium]